ncbi:Abi-alpha family protein [Paraburkholderia sp. SUR17]|uniref:Abi-alpha family protein n=1 Tax=Paraburkholderia sp. SUR17 TaxID=3034358 RepID=UPI002407BA0F|nr:Abi-alpha family protein [Paraburkholderia sp. SUR17]WEY37765.1 Abi-alpha family protein [Paraburkholderia sp. SUR17]
MADPVQATTEGAKAIGEVAKTAGKVVDAARDMGGFIAKYTHGTLEQAMGIVHDKIAYARWERQYRLMDRASAFLSARGVKHPPTGIPLKLAVPLLQAATLEDDDYVQDMWAQLLVNSSIEPNPQNRAFISMLENMTPLDALVLNELARAEGTPYTPMLTYELPERAHPVLDLKSVEPLTDPSEDVAFSLSNLARISAITPAATWDGGITVAQVKLTMLGRQLVRACSGTVAE